MAQRKGTVRRKTRKLFSKNFKDKGKVSISEYFKVLNVGDTVAVLREPAIRNSQYHSRFYGVTGKVTSKRGSCYVVSFKDRTKEKSIIVHPVHLKLLKAK